MKIAVEQLANKLELFIPCHPRGQGRPRAVNRGGFTSVYKDKKSREYENQVRVMVAGKLPFGWKTIPKDTPIVVEWEFAMIRPKSVSAKKRPYPVVGFDLSNLVKAVEDACNRIVWHDDCQIVKSGEEKIYGDVPGVRAIIRW